MKFKKVEHCDKNLTINKKIKQLNKLKYGKCCIVKAIDPSPKQFWAEEVKRSQWQSKAVKRSQKKSIEVKGSQNKSKEVRKRQKKWKEVKRVLK